MPRLVFKHLLIYYARRFNFALENIAWNPEKTPIS